MVCMQDPVFDSCYVFVMDFFQCNNQFVFYMYFSASRLSLCVVLNKNGRTCVKHTLNMACLLIQALTSIAQTHSD